MLRAVHRSVQVKFVPNPKPTWQNRVLGKLTCRRPSEQTGRADHTSMGAWTGRSTSKIWENDKKKARKLREKVRKTQIRRKSHQNLWDFVRSGFNLTGFDEISLDSVKISLDLREIAPKSGFFIAEIWVFIARI